MQVEVCYASPKKQSLKTVTVAEHALVKDAITQSNILLEFPEIDLDSQSVGIFSLKAKLTDKLRPGDRVEIYRPLTIDPKEARRLRALKK